MKKIVRLTENDLTRIVKRVIRESKEINEIGGISSGARSWSEILVSKIKESFGKDFTINGKDFPEVYEKFPADYFKVNFLPIGAFGYDQDNSGFVGNEYVVTLAVDPRIAYKINTSIINHEMKHAYQDFKRYENKSVGIKDSNFIKNMYTKDFEKFIVGFMQGRDRTDTLITILYLYYVLSKVEQDAYLENIYDEILGSGGGYYLQVMSSLKLLERLNFSSLNSETWEKLRRADIPFIKKFKTKEEFANYSEKYLKRLGENFRKKINKMKYLNFTNPKQQKTEKPPERETKKYDSSTTKIPNSSEKQLDTKLTDSYKLNKLEDQFNNQELVKDKKENHPFVGNQSFDDIKNAFDKLIKK